MVKLIIAGSRSIYEPMIVEAAIDRYQLRGQISEIIEGGCAKGIDRIASIFAKMHSLPHKVFKANWNAYGKAAGPIRNAEMAKYGDMLLAIWDGKSKGTANMIEQMKRRGKPVFVYEA